MPKFELQKIGFVNPSDLTENVVFSTILEGSDGATRSFVEDTAEGYVIEDNQTIEDDIQYKLTALGKKTDNTDQAQLYSWANNRDKITIIGYAYDKAMIIENAYLQQRAKGKDRLTWMVMAQKAGDVGYDSDGKLDTEFMMSKNLLNMYYFQNDGTGLLAGWSKTGGSTSFTGGDQVFSTTGATVVYMQRDILFPFEKQITFALNTVSATSTTGIYIGIQAFDEDDAEIGSESTQAITSTGVESVTRTLPSGTIKVRLRIKIAQDDSIRFNNAALNLGTSTTYTSQ